MSPATHKETPMNTQLTIANDGQAVHHPVAMTPMDMLNVAVERGANIETLEKLMALQERWEGNQARKAFDDALAAAKAEIPVILKNKVVDFTSSKGRTHYQHEDLAEIARTVDPILSRHGLSYRFRTMSLPNEPVSVTCIVSHRLGYSEENSLQAGRDDSGNKNSIQQVGSTITYLQRYTLKAALGLAASTDNDGAKADEDGSVITDKQLLRIRALIEDTDSDIEKLCAYLSIESLPEMNQTKFEAAIKLLEAKKAKSKKGNTNG